VLISGLLVGVLYSLVALGFVLIFKASGVLQLRAGAIGADARWRWCARSRCCRSRAWALWAAVILAFLFARRRDGPDRLGRRAAGPAQG